MSLIKKIEAEARELCRQRGTTNDIAIQETEAAIIIGACIGIEHIIGMSVPDMDKALEEANGKA